MKYLTAALVAALILLPTKGNTVRYRIQSDRESKGGDAI